MSRLTTIAALAIVGVLAGVTPAAAGVPPTHEVPTSLLAKAAADECYGGIGASYVAKGSAACADDRQPKVNQAYVWGLARSGSNVWFGTAPNVQCLVISGYLGMTSAMENDAWTCEFGESGFAKTVPGLPAALGDWRPSDLFRHDVTTGTQEKVSTQLTGIHAQRLSATLGIRSAGSLGRLVMFAGPSMSFSGGLNLFAFDGVTGKFVSSTTLPAYDNIRRWIVVDGQLYTAVGKAGPGGALLRWNGNADDIGTAAAPSASLFDLTVVGSLPSEGADLADHEGRIFVTTWPSGSVEAGLYMSPVVPAGGLPASDAALERVWTASDYEPDQITAATYGGGALASYQGKLVWGTMHVPFTAALAHADADEVRTGSRASVKDALETVAGSWRAVAVFSGDDLGTPDQRIRVLYGNTVLPAYTPGKGWKLVPNNAHQVPKLGSSGFDDPFNNYTWVMGQTKTGLYVGTMDWSYLFAKALPMVVEQISGRSVTPDALDVPAPRYGADLMKFRDLKTPAYPASRFGTGNFANYGIRTMVAEPDRLYFGTANPMNLLTDDSGALLGGWELRRLGPAEEAAVPVTPPAQQPAAVNAPVVTVQAQSTSQCKPKRKFVMHLGFRLKLADANHMANVRRTIATVDGKTVRAYRSPNGIDIPVDLRKTTKRRVTVTVELRLKKPVRTVHRSGTKSTTKVVRSYRFIVC